MKQPLASYLALESQAWAAVTPLRPEPLFWPFLAHLSGGEAPKGVPLLGQPLHHRQGSGHVSQERVGQQGIGCHFHLGRDHCNARGQLGPF